MQRRTFLVNTATAGAAAATAAATFPAPAISQNRREWRMVTSWPRGLPGIGTGAGRLADTITRMTDGRITVKLYAAGELVPALQCFDAVADGTAELAHDAAYYHISKAEVVAFFSAFPWGLTASELSGWIKYGGGQELWDELYAPFGIKPFLAGNTGTQMLGWFRNEIRSLDDIQGLKFRAPGNGGRVWRKLGATVVTLPGGEIFQALQSGALDGAEWVGPYNDLSLGFYQVAKYYYSPGYHEPGTALQMMVNKPAYDALPDDLKAILAHAATAANDDIYAEYVANSGPALRALVQRHGVQLRIVPRQILMAMGDAANELLADVAGIDDLSRRIVESYLAYRAAVVPWTTVGELQFLKSRELPFPHALPG